MFRNLTEDATIEIYFETFASTGAPVAPSSAFTTSDFAIYKNGSATAKATTNGLTVTSPFNSETGCHLLVIDTSNDTGDSGFWTTGARYQVKFNTAKTVGSQSIDGVSVPRGSFGIQSEYMRGTDSAALASGVTVSAINANVITAASIAADAITDAKVASDVTIASVTGSVGSVTAISTGAITATSFAAGAIDAAAIATDAIGSAEISAAAVTKIQTGLATPTNITAGTITTVTNLTNAPTSGDLTATMKASVTAAVPTAAVIADSVWDEVRTGHTTAGTFGFYLDAAISGISGGLDAGGVRSAIGLSSANLDTQLSGIQSDTNDIQSRLPTALESGRIAAALDSAERNTLVDLVWDESMSGHTTAGTYGGRIVRATNSNTEVQITGSNHIAADVHEFQTAVITAEDFAANAITASALATDAVTEIQNGLATAASITTMRGADNDTLKTLSDQIDGILNAGSGARTVTITVNDGTTVLQNARVRVNEGANTYTSLTNVSGVVTFNLDDATYTVAITKSGYSYAGTTLVVDGTETRTYSMTLVSLPEPSTPDKTVLTILCLDNDGDAVSAVNVSIRYTAIPTGSEDIAFPGGTITKTSNGSGIVSFEVIKGSTIEYKRGTRDVWIEALMSDEDNTSITSFIGTP